MEVQRAGKIFCPQVHYICIAKLKTISQDLNYNGVKYITSETGFQHFENNFINKLKTNSGLWKHLI